MKTTSLEVSKRLKELSDWDCSSPGGSWRWCKISTNPSHWELLRLDDARAYNPEFEKAWFNGIDAYDLGYLLRKLPAKYFNLIKVVDSPEYLCYIYKNGAIVEEFGADNPEDAAGLLAIELFERGVLAKEVE